MRDYDVVQPSLVNVLSGPSGTERVSERCREDNTSKGKKLCLRTRRWVRLYITVLVSRNIRTGGSDLLGRVELGGSSILTSVFGGTGLLKN